MNTLINHRPRQVIWSRTVASDILIEKAKNCRFNTRRDSANFLNIAWHMARVWNWDRRGLACPMVLRLLWKHSSAGDPIGTFIMKGRFPALFPDEYVSSTTDDGNPFLSRHWMYSYPALVRNRLGVKIFNFFKSNSQTAASSQWYTSRCCYVLDWKSVGELSNRNRLCMQVLHNIVLWREIVWVVS